MYSATLKYSEKLVHSAVWSFVRRSLGVHVLVGVLFLCCWHAFEIFIGDRSWRVGLLAGAAAIVIAMPILLYVVHYRNSMAKFRQMKLPVATFSAEDETFTLAADHGTATLKWEAIKEIRGFDGFWLLLFSKSHFATMPLDGVSVEMREFILQKVKQNGGRTAI